MGWLIGSHAVLGLSSYDKNRRKLVRFFVCCFGLNIQKALFDFYFKRFTLEITLSGLRLVCMYTVKE